MDPFENVEYYPHNINYVHCSLVITLYFFKAFKHVHGGGGWNWRSGFFYRPPSLGKNMSFEMVGGKYDLLYIILSKKRKWGGKGGTTVNCTWEKI